MVFFLEGVATTTDDAVRTARALVDTFERDRQRIQDLGRRTGSALRVQDVLKSRPVLVLPEVVTRSGLSFPAAAAAMDALEELGVVRELTGKKRNRVFAYSEYLRLLSEGT